MARIDRAYDVRARDFYLRRELFYPDRPDNFSQGDLNRYAFIAGGDKASQSKDIAVSRSVCS
jgi:hypothetical protein